MRSSHQSPLKPFRGANQRSLGCMRAPSCINMVVCSMSECHWLNNVSSYSSGNYYTLLKFTVGTIYHQIEQPCLRIIHTVDWWHIMFIYFKIPGQKFKRRWFRQFIVFSQWDEDNCTDRSARSRRRNITIGWFTNSVTTQLTSSEASVKLLNSTS